MELNELEARRQELLKKVNPLCLLMKKLYGNVDISEPKSEAEKSLEKEIAGIFSEVNSIIRAKRELRQTAQPTL